MNKIAERYMDLCIIDEYADKDLQCGYSIDISDIPIEEIHNLIDVLLTHDMNFRDFIFDHLGDILTRRVNKRYQDDITDLEVNYAR